MGFARLYGAEPTRAAGPSQRAIALAEEVREQAPDDAAVLIHLASIYAATDQGALGRERPKAAIALSRSDPQLIAEIAEAYEDLGDREHALTWIATALCAGKTPAYFERRPALRNLVTDPRYQRLAAGEARGPG